MRQDVRKCFVVGALCLWLFWDAVGMKMPTVGIEEEILKEQLTPNELFEICKKFWEVNKLEDFFVQMKPVMKGITTLIGFKEQLPSA